MPLISSTAPLMPGFLALAQVHDLDAVALSLGPARVHAHEHLRPVLRLGAAGAGADLELRIAEVVRMRQQRSETKLFELLARRARPRARPRLPSPRPAPASSISASSRALCMRATIPSNGSTQFLSAFTCCTTCCAASWLFQKSGLPIRASSCGQLLPLVIEVKGTSSARRADRRTRTAAWPARFPPCSFSHV